MMTWARSFLIFFSTLPRRAGRPVVEGHILMLSLLVLPYQSLGRGVVVEGSAEQVELGVDSEQ